jgi:hypothetical protein
VDLVGSVAGLFGVMSWFARDMISADNVGHG